MFHAEVRFVPRSRREKEPLIQAVWQYAGWLYRHGQIGYDHSVSQNGSLIRLLCMIPGRCSLDLRFNDARGRAGLRCIRKLSAKSSLIRITGKAVETPDACSCRHRPSIHLFTHFLDDSSPLACGACRQPIRFYRLRRLDLSMRATGCSWTAASAKCGDTGRCLGWTAGLRRRGESCARNWKPSWAFQFFTTCSGIGDATKRRSASGVVQAAKELGCYPNRRAALTSSATNAACYPAWLWTSQVRQGRCTKSRQRLGNEVEQGQGEPGLRGRRFGAEAGG
jgi:hypothetical protein